MAKKKATQQASIMDQLAGYSPPWDDSADKPKEKEFDAAAEIKSLTERLAKVEADKEALIRQQTYSSFQSQVSAAPAAASRPSTEVSFEGMPDPVTETAKYTAELVKRINAANDAKLAIIQAEGAVERERAQLENSLWEGFQKAHPAWAEQDALVEVAASRVAQGMARRGVNVMALVKAQPEVFYGEVADFLEKQFPKMKSGAEEVDEDEGGGEEDHRTSGVFGGTPGKQGGAHVQTDTGESSTMLRELAEMQYKAGVR